MLNFLQKNYGYKISVIWLITICLITLGVRPSFVASQPLPNELAAVAWSPSGDKIAGVGLNGLLRIWDNEGNLLQDFQGIERAVTTVAWSPDGTRIASGGSDTTVRIWDVNGTLITSMEGHTANIMSVAWSPDGSFLATASHTGRELYTLRIWDGNNYQPLIEENYSRINSIAWNPNLTQHELAFAKENGYVTIETVTPTELQFFDLAYQNAAPMFSVGWISDGSRLASGDITGKIDIWNPTNFDNIRTLIGHTDLIGALVWSPDDTQLASASSDGTIRVWDVATGQTTDIFQNPKQTFTTSIDWNSTGFIFGTANATVEIIQFPTANAGLDQTIADNDNSGSELVTLDGSASSDPDGSLVSYSWNENGTTIATGSNPQVDLSVGTHNIELTVTDDDGATGRDIVVITVEAPLCNNPNPITDTTTLISEIAAGNTFGAPYTICLENSTYTLDLVNNSSSGDNGLPVITGDITIIGNGATITRDVAAAGFRFFNVAASGSLTLESMTLSNGDASASIQDGGAIYSEGTVTLDTVTFNNNSAVDGGAISVVGGNLTVSNSSFDSNSVSEEGGAIELDVGSIADVSASAFSNNTAGLDGGAIQSQTATLTISNSSFSSNSAADDGGAITQKEGTLTLSDSTLSNNVAGTISGNVGGGIYSTGVLTLSNTHITSDGLLTNAYNGGGIFYENSLGTLTINNGSSISNQIAAKNGGGIYLAAGTLDLDDSTLDSNIAQGDGGGAIYNTSAIDIANSSLLNNQATTNNGGAIRNTGTVILTNVNLNNNLANTASGKGGAIYNLAGTTTITGGTINQNQTYDGGAIYVAADTVSLSNVTLFDNDATDDGGAAYIVNGGALMAVTSTFDMNSAVDDGGAVDNRGAFTITASQFVNNSADDGGAIDTKTAGTNAINYSCISGNIVADDTSGIRSSQATLNAENNWWGDTGGPSGAGTGLGDEVSVNVDFDPHNAVSCADALSVQGASIASLEVNTMQFLDTQNAMQLPFVASQEDEAFWQVTGAWDLVTVAGRPSPTWVVDAVPRYQESILEFIFPLDLGNRANPVLAFQQKIELGGTDTFMIEVLPENSTEWVVIDSQSAVNSDWQTHTIDLDAYRGQVIRLRGRLVTGDDVEGEISTGVWLDTIGLGY